MIRPFRFDDAMPCWRLIQDCLNSDPFLSPSISRKLRDGESPQTITERARLFYIAVFELDSEIVGIAGLDLNEIRLMYVSPRRRRTGIGKALYYHLAEMAPDTFFREIFVYSSPSAVGFYKALGFVEKGPVSFDVDGELMTTTFMSSPIHRSIIH
jgi:ribosomal protein S18 acetylase RimI-like enzyme